MKACLDSHFWVGSEVINISKTALKTFQNSKEYHKFKKKKQFIHFFSYSFILLFFLHVMLPLMKWFSLVRSECNMLLFKKLNIHITNKEITNHIWLRKIYKIGTCLYLQQSSCQVIKMERKFLPNSAIGLILAKIYQEKIESKTNFRKIRCTKTNITLIYTLYFYFSSYIFRNRLVWAHANYNLRNQKHFHKKQEHRVKGNIYPSVSTITQEFPYHPS